MLDILFGIGYTLLTIILGKIVFYYIVTFIEYVYYLFNKKELNKEAMKSILNELIDNKAFIQDAGKLLTEKEEMNEDTARQIIRLPYVQRQIIWKIEEKRYLKKSVLEEELIQIILRGWSNKNPN